MRFEWRARQLGITPTHCGFRRRRAPAGAGLAVAGGRCGLLAAARGRHALCALATVAAGFALGAAVEVVDLHGRERHAVDGLAVLLVVVVAQAADDVDVGALAQVLGRVLGLLAPQRPLDRGRLFLTAVAAAAPGVADRGQHALGNLAFAAVDEFELDGARQVRVTLDDLYVGHDQSPCVREQPGHRPGVPEN